MFKGTGIAMGLIVALGLLGVQIHCGGGGSSDGPTTAAPSITAQPQGLTVVAQTATVTSPVSATFSVTATGNPAPAYQWYLNGSAISGANSTYYTTYATAVSNNGDSYTVVVSNGVGTPVTSHAAILTVDAAPVITSQRNAVAATSGDPATFSVTVTGNPAPSFQWYVSGVPIPGATSASYTTAACTPDMNGENYTVTASNSLGSVSSLPIVLTVDCCPIFTAQPASVTVNAGVAATFTAAATGTPAPAYQWYLGGSAIPGATSASFTTAAATAAMNGGSYTVTATNASGSATSSAAILTVNAVGPAITGQPASATVTAPATATFTVAATGTPAPTYQWYLGGTAIAGATSASYTTAATTLAMNGGSYTVTATNALGSVTSSAAILTVDAAPAITAQPASVTVGAGAAATFTVTATGNPAPTYQWNLGGTAIAGATSASYTTAATTQAMNGGSYTVTVTNALGSVTSSAAVLTVNTSPAITTQPASVTVNAGAAATFSVVATGQPAPTYAWSLNGAAIAGATAASYTTAATTSAMNQGSYTVTVTNTFGSVTSSPAILTVDYAPAITTQPASATVTAGATATFTVTATGNPTPTYQWNLGGAAISGATSASYTTAATTTAMSGGSYTVTVTNSVGSLTSSAAILTVDSAPTTPVITGPAAVNANSTNNTASVPAQAGSTYAWTITGGTITAGGTTTSVTFTAGASGSVVLTCVVTNSAGTASSPGTDTIPIDAAPTTPTISAPAYVTANATGLTATISNTATEPTGSTYAWTITSGGTITAGAATATITFTAGASGTVAFSCVVTTPANSTSTGTASSTIVAGPVAPVISVPANVTAATGLTATITNTASEPTGTTYAWTITGASPTTGTGTSVTVTAGASGTVQFSCVATNTGGTASAAGTASSTIVPAPDATITANPDPVTSGSTGNGASVPVQGGTFAWTISSTGGTVAAAITSLTTVNPITYDAGTGNTSITLGCTVTNAAGATATGSLVVPDPASAAGIQVLISDATTEDWATIGVKVLSIGLIPQGGSAASPVAVYTAPAPVPVTNLVQLDSLSELLGLAQVAPGTYTGAVLVLSANPGDVTLVSAADPSAGFKGAAATPVSAGRIQIQGAVGSAGHLTVPITVPFATNLVAAAGQANPMDLEFDLGHPAFIVDHLAQGDPAPVWAVNFNGPVRFRPAAATDLILRHLYGSIGAVAADSSSLTLTKANPAWPPADPETANPTAQSLRILADSGNGTLCYDLDAGTASTVTDFSSMAGTLAGRYVRAAVRYQSDGTLVAARIWAGSAFNTVYNGPEGHVLHVDAGAGVLTVANQDGAGVPILVTPATRFFLRNPADAAADATPIGSGPAFMGTSLVRGFKVHATVDPATTPMTAQTVDIEVARFEGAVTADADGFTLARAFASAADDYTVALGFATGSAAGTLEAAAGPVAFGGGLPAMLPWAASIATWNDPANPAGWSAKSALLEATALPVGTVASPWSAGSASFGLVLPGGADLVPVDLDLAGGSSLVYQVDRTGGIVTLNPVDLATASGQASLLANLGTGATVKVYGIPQAGGHIKAKVVFYYTGALPL